MNATSASAAPDVSAMVRRSTACVECSRPHADQAIDAAIPHSSIPFSAAARISSR